MEDLHFLTGCRRSKRAIRRHHYRRLQKTRRDAHYWGRGYVDGHLENHDWDPCNLGMVATTPKLISSCICCMNQRKVEGDTLAERRNHDSFQQQIEDLKI